MKLQEFLSFTKSSYSYPERLVNVVLFFNNGLPEILDENNLFSFRHNFGSTYGDIIPLEDCTIFVYHLLDGYGYRILSEADLTRIGNDIRNTIKDLGKKIVYMTGTIVLFNTCLEIIRSKK